MMKIGLFSDTYLPEINGVASSVHILRKALEAKGHTVFVITTKSVEKEDDEFVMRLSGIELKKLYGYVMTSPINLQAYSKIKEMKLDLVHVHTEFGVGIFARYVAKKQGIPLVSTYHTTYEDYTHYVNVVNSEIVDKFVKKAVARLSRFYVNSSAEVIAPSYKTKKMLEGYKVKSRIHVVPTGLELERFAYSLEKEKQGQAIRKELRISEEECLIVYLGRVAQEKGIHLLIDGMKEATKKGIQCKLLIVGAGPAEDLLKKQTEQLGLQNQVIFVGKKPNEEVPAYYAAADCFASASTSETQGMTYIEAMASGLTVLARPDEILKELIYEGETGYYFDNADEFSEKVSQFMQLTKDKRKSIADKVRERVAPYNMDKFYDGVIAVYQSALTQKQQEGYEIEKIHSKKDYVHLTLKSPKNEMIKILVDTDIYIEMGYRKGRLLSYEEVEELERLEAAVEAYQRCLRKLSIKDRTRKEMYDWLTQNTSLDISDINHIIERLETYKYIDDERYTKDSVYNMKMTLAGEKKIYNNLRKKGVHPDLIRAELETERDADQEYENALKWANKAKDSIKDKSVRMKKQVLHQKLINQGFSGEILDRVIREIDFVNDELKEMDVLRKVAGKARKRSEKKYQGYQLRNAIYRYCATQGFEPEKVYTILDEMEWDDEKN